jgi:phosphate transport system protein
MPDRTHFSQEREKIDRDLLAMGTRVEEQLGKALRAMRDLDIDLAREVKADDEAVDGLQIAIEDQVTVMIATQAPVAMDVRELVAALKLADNLERAGDYAVHLAKAVKKFALEPKFRQVERLERMAQAGAVMVRGVVDAFLAKDAEAARRVAAMDDAIDHEHKALVDEVLILMREQPEQAERAAKLLTTSGFLERLGDHATNASEAIVYMVEGRHVDLNE